MCDDNSVCEYDTGEDAKVFVKELYSEIKQLRKQVFFDMTKSWQDIRKNNLYDDDFHNLCQSDKDCAVKMANLYAREVELFARQVKLYCEAIEYEKELNFILFESCVIDGKSVAVIDMFADVAVELLRRR